jgi:Transglycosylase SLT domain
MRSHSAVLGVGTAGLAVGTSALAMTLLLALTLGAVHGAPTSLAVQRAGVSAAAQAQIPAAYLRLYQQAAQRYGLDWAILAGIGRVECNHGRDPDPACTREGAVNSAGAGGPMQFLASTWARYGVDGNGDGRTDRWDPADAIYGAARYLRAAGAPADYEKAILAYNHAGWYVAEVEHWATVYRGPSAASSSSVAEVSAQLGPREQAVLSPADGHVALAPAAAPAVVQAMVQAGNELQELPYGISGHPDPRGAVNEDCSSTVNYVLYRSGIRPIEEIVRKNPLAQNYVNWGLPGPGRWVSIYATTSPSDHVFMVIAGLRLDTSHNGTDVGPNRAQEGPRWRILDHIPTWAHWSVRHPPGL